MTGPQQEHTSGAQAAENDTTSFQSVIPIRWSDQDTNGHVNNARVVTLMEEARILWLNKHAASEGVNSFSHPKLVASLNVDYLKPISYGPDLTVKLHIGNIGVHSFTVCYEASQNSDSVFRASTIVVPIDPNSGKKRRLTDAEIRYLSGYLSNK